MIRKTLRSTKEATFCVELPYYSGGPPLPTGTGFFVSSDGWFVTAAHVVMDSGMPRNDIEQMWLKKPGELNSAQQICQKIRFIDADEINDFALLKVDFRDNSNKDWLQGRKGFPHLDVSIRLMEEGEPVYSFGYPLSGGGVLPSAGMTSPSTIQVGTTNYSPRVTSAVVASLKEKHGMFQGDADPIAYVIDKALNYGNSGGPIIATETGKVFAFCSRFQPVIIQQPQLGVPGNPIPVIAIPSLYGVVSSLSNPSIVAKLKKCGIPIHMN